MDDQEYLPLSWLSQICYCPRRAALLLNERLWEESTDTAKGRSEHQQVHTRRVEKRGDFLKLYEFTVFSDRLSLLGKCDCIEAEETADGCCVPALPFPVKLYPVEYKHGKIRSEQEYEIQLCAQAMCLEEMFQTRIPEGAIYYITSHRRYSVPLTEKLRNRVRETIREVQLLRHDFSIPPAEYGAKCKACSLREYCLPNVKQSALDYCKRLQEEAIEEEAL